MKTVSKKISRGSEVDTELCTQMAGGNRFDLVLIATARSREISRKHKHDEMTTHVNAPVTALLEVQAGRVDPKVYLNKV
jgi:DNA-directed RNA polymerase subunit K/omega